jgi:hypothetical protein
MQRQIVYQILKKLKTPEKRFLLFFKNMGQGCPLKKNINIPDFKGL